jgi:hypothetical protein
MVKTTYRDPGAVGVDFNIAHVDPKITRILDQHPDPLVQGFGREIILGGAHEVVAPRVMAH